MGKMDKLHYWMYFSSLDLHNRVRELPKITIFAKLGQFLSLVTILLIENTSNQTLHLETITKFGQNVEQIANQMRTFVLIWLSFVFGLLAVVKFVRTFIKSELISYEDMLQDQRSPLSSFWIRTMKPYQTPLLLIEIGFLYLLELLIIPGLWTLNGEINTTSPNILWKAVVPVFALMYKLNEHINCLSCDFSRQSRLFTKSGTSLLGAMTPVPILLLNLGSLTDWKIFLALLMIVLAVLYREKGCQQTFDRIFILNLFVCSAFFLYLKTKESQQNVQIQLTYFSLICLLVNAIAYKQCSRHASLKLRHDEDFERLYNVIVFLVTMKGTQPCKQLGFKSFYELCDTIRRLKTVDQKATYKEIDAMVNYRQSPKDLLKFKDVEKDQIMKDICEFLKRQERASNEQTKKTIKFLGFVIALGRDTIPNCEKVTLLKDLYGHFQSFSAMSGVERFRCFDLMQRAELKFNRSQQGKLKVADVISFAQLSNSFRANLLKTIDRLYKLWSYLQLEERPSVADLRDIVSSVMECESLLDCEFARLKVFHQNLSQFLLYKHLKSKLDQYSQLFELHGDSASQASIQSSIDQELVESLSKHYLVLKDEKVVRVSRPFLSQLGWDQQSQEMVDSSNFDSIFQRDFFQQVLNSVGKDSADLGNESDQQSHRSNSNITIVSSRQREILYCNFEVYWIPDFGNSIKHLVTLKDLEILNKHSLFTFNRRTNQIHSFNRKFFEEFKIEKKKLSERLSNEGIFFDELFCTESDFEPTFQPNQTFKFRLNKDILGLKRSPATLKAEVSVYRQIENSALKTTPSNPNFSVYILSISSSDAKRKETMDFKDSSNQSQSRALGSNQQRLEDKYKNERFFCPIPNVYIHKINEKLSQLNSSGGGSTLSRNFSVTIIFILVISVMVGSNLYYYNSYQDRLAISESYAANLERSNLVYRSMGIMYSCFFRSFYYSQFPASTTIATGVPASIAVARYKGGISYYSEGFIKNYLFSLNDQFNKQVDFQIEFKGFTVQTSTAQSTLMDYFEHFQKFVEDSSLENSKFLIKNYVNFLHILEGYQNSFNYESLTQNSEDILYQSYVPIFLLSILLFCALLWGLYKVEVAIRSPYELIQFIDRQKTEEEFNKLGILRQTMFNELEQKSMISELELQGHSNQLASFPGQSEVSMRRQIDFIEQERKLKPSDKQQISGEETVKKQSILVFMLRYSIISLVAGYLIFYTHSEFTELRVESKQQVEVFQMKGELFKMMFDFRRVEIGTTFRPSYPYVFGQELPEGFQVFTVNNKLRTSVETTLSDPKYSGFIQELRNYFERDICQYGPRFAHSGPMSCDDLLGGVLREGTSKAFRKVYEESVKMSLLPMQQLIPVPTTRCIAHNCQPYLEVLNPIISLCQTVLGAMQLASQKMKQVTQQKKEQKFQEIELRIIYSLVLLILGLVWLKVSLQKRCSLSLKLIKLYPQQMISTMKMTTHMRKRDTLENLMWI